MWKTYYAHSLKFDIIFNRKKQKILSCPSPSYLHVYGPPGENHTCYENMEKDNFFVSYFGE